MKIIAIAVMSALLPWPCLGQAGLPSSGTALSAAEAKPAAARQREAGIEWVTIHGGSFMMGADDLGSDALPSRQVKVKTFQMAKSLVTVEQYKACVDAGTCTAPDTGENCNWGVPERAQHPVNCVDWKQAAVFSAWAGGRLPSEAEWEYAARSAGKDWKYPWGDDDATCKRAVIREGDHGGCGRDSTWPVCSKPKGNTKQKLCDMAGNVAEWVRDWYYYSYNGAPTDGSAWEFPEAVNRVARGGSWKIGAENARSADRGIVAPGVRANYLGFRPARQGR